MRFIISILFVVVLLFVLVNVSVAQEKEEPKNFELMYLTAMEQIMLGQANLINTKASLSACETSLARLTLPKQLKAIQKSIKAFDPPVEEENGD